MFKRSSLVVMLVLAVAGGAALAGCSTQPAPTPDTGTAAQQQPAEQPAEQPATNTPIAKAPAGSDKVTKLVIKDEVVGTGAAAKKGDKVQVDYTGWLTDGQQFDSSQGRGPFTFTLGAGEVIPGWDQGVVGMKVGGTRKLTIPSSLGYGPQGTPDGTIPPNSALIFQVKLLKVN